MKQGPFKMKGKSPMMKALIGKQNNLPAELKAKILASPATMKKESMATMKKESMAKMKKAPAKMKKESMTKMKKKSMTKMKKGDRPKPDPTGYDPVEKPKKTTFAEAYKKRDMKTYGNLNLKEYTAEAKRQIANKKSTTVKGGVEVKGRNAAGTKTGPGYGYITKPKQGSYDAPKSQMKGSVKPSDETTEAKAKATKLPVGDRKLKKVTTKPKNEVKKQKRLARNEKQKAMAKDLKYRLLGKAGRAKMEAKGYVPKSKRK